MVENNLVKVNLECIFSSGECQNECPIHPMVEMIRNKPQTKDGEDIITMARRVYTQEEKTLKCGILR